MIGITIKKNNQYHLYAPALHLVQNYFKLTEQVKSYLRILLIAEQAELTVPSMLKTKLIAGQPELTIPSMLKPFVHLIRVPDAMEVCLTGNEKVNPSSLCLLSGR